MFTRSKLPQQETTIFAVMSAMAREHNAINLSQGFPNFSPDQKLLDLLTKAVNNGANQYAPMPGHPGLREVLARKHNSAYSCQLNPGTDITITAGATQAIFTAIAALVHEGDEVIYFEPAYDCYLPAIQTVGAIPKAIPVKAPNFQIDWEYVENTISEKTKMVIVNTPSNPGCYTWSESDWQNLERLVQGKSIVVLSDEVYEHLTLNGNQHISVLDRPGLADQRLATFSFGKIFHVTGWKIGYAAGSTALMEEFRNIHQFNVFSVNNPCQQAIYNYLLDSSNYLELSTFFQKKHDVFIEKAQESRFQFLPTGGSYFVLADYSKISDLPDREFAIWLTKEHGIATIPLSPFYSESHQGQKLVRFCFAKTEDLLLEAGERLQSI